VNGVVDVRRTVDAVWRIESGRLIGSLARMLRDVGRAEEVAQDTFVAALEQWPDRGIPENPAAWMMATARNKAIDLIRREVSREEKYAEVAVELDKATDRDDDLLSLVFIACHPVLPQESRVALTLRMVGGLSTDQIARGFLVPSATIGQRIARAKRTLAEAHTPFEAPAAAELPERLSAVLEVIYLIFNEGYSASSGETWMRRDLAEEAMRLGRMLTGLLPKEPEVRGLAALMELQASRFGARTGPDGVSVLLADQDRSRWDRTLMNHGLAALDVATRLGRPLGPYTIQAAIAACHTRASSYEDTDWEAIVSLYDALAQLAPSPVVELNRAVALLHADGPEAALEALERIRSDPRMARYHLFGAVRGDVLTHLGRHTEAADVLEAAAGVAPTQRERNLLMERAAAAMDLADAE